MPILLLALLIFGGWGSWRGAIAIVDSDFLTTRYLEVSGCRVLPEELVTEILEPHLGCALARLPMDSLRTQIASLPRVESFSLERRLPGTLRCRIEEARPLFLLLDAGFHELDEDGNILERFGTAAPDLPILLPSEFVSRDSLVVLAHEALVALENASFDLGRELSEIFVESRGLAFTRNEGGTLVLLGWSDISARVEAYREFYPKLIAENDFPRELDMRYRDQVVARD
jgi:cell division septal protein FtsQ